MASNCPCVDRFRFNDSRRSKGNFGKPCRIANFNVVTTYCLVQAFTSFDCSTVDYSYIECVPLVFLQTDCLILSASLCRSVNHFKRFQNSNEVSLSGSLSVNLSRCFSHKVPRRVSLTKSQIVSPCSWQTASSL